jgi:hypothetical protein
MSMTLDECDRLFEAAQDATTVSAACHALAPLFDAFKGIEVAVARSNTYWRARIAEEQPWPAAAAMAKMLDAPAGTSVRMALQENYPC